MLGGKQAPKEFMAKEESSVKTIGLVLLIAIMFTGIVYFYATNRDAMDAIEQGNLENRINKMQEEIDSMKSSQKDAVSTQNNTATGWETYKNTKYGYSLNYPNDFELHARDESLNNIAVSPAAANIAVSNDGDGIFDVIFENIQFTTDGIKGVFDETDPSKVALTPTTIAGKPAYQVKYDKVSDEKYDLYFVKSPSETVLRLMVARNTVGAPEILSSFTFEK